MPVYVASYIGTVIGAVDYIALQLSAQSNRFC